MNLSDNKLPSKEIQDKMSACREILLNNGFLEPTKFKNSEWKWLFYKPNLAHTAFAINLYGYFDYIEIIYGYASTAFTLLKGDENALVERGIDSDLINLRSKVVLFAESDCEKINCLIEELYAKYEQTSKPEIFELVKTKRKEFIGKITLRLKPLGFKKKANFWKYIFENGYYLMLNAQKSSFSDEYYFNVYIGKENTNLYGDCYYSRLTPDNIWPMDWQTISDKRFDDFLDKELVTFLKKMIAMPLCDLGKEPFIREHCECDGKQCENCWVDFSNRK